MNNILSLIEMRVPKSSTSDMIFKHCNWIKTVNFGSQVHMMSYFEFIPKFLDSTF